MKLLMLLLAMVIFSVTGFSQTKKIAHRSHSGKNSTFTLNGPDNFGETPEMIEAKKKRDADKLKADSIAKQAIADSIAKLKTGQKIKHKSKSKDPALTPKDTTSKHR